MKCLRLGIFSVMVTLMFAWASPVQGEMVGIYWQAVEIEGQPVTLEASKQEPHLVFTAEGRVSGATGCNRLTGSYEHHGSSLHFKPLATTKMACPPPLAGLEQSFLQALAATTGVSQFGKVLKLQDAGGKVRMILEARE